MTRVVRVGLKFDQRHPHGVKTNTDFKKETKGSDCCFVFHMHSLARYLPNMNVFFFPVRLLTVVFSPLTEVAFAASFFAKGYAILSPLVIVIEEDSNEESDVYCDWNGCHANSG